MQDNCLLGFLKGFADQNVAGTEEPIEVLYSILETFTMENAFNPCSANI